METNSTALLNFQTLSNTQFMVHIFATIYPLTFFCFDALLFVATVYSRRDATIPVSYICVMCLRGMLSNFLYVLQYSMYLFSTPAGYQDYLTTAGREATLLGTFTYLMALLVTVLMSVNRIAVVIKPFNEWFSHTKVFIYCIILSIGLLISLIIPYLGPCYITFIVDRKGFISACAPDKHPITVFQNTYAIILPFACMFVNLSIILHLGFVRNNSYIICCHKIRGNVRASNTSQSNLFLKKRARRDAMMIRHTILIAIYLSIYEFGAFIIRVFPELYTGLSPTGKEVYFYIRMESVPIMNFFIYFIETKKTRTMVKRFLCATIDQGSNVGTISHQTASGPQGHVVTV